MKKFDLGQSVTVLANIGVIVGIVLLAFELQQNNELLRNQARYNLQLARSQELTENWQYPEMREITAKALRDRTELSPSEDGRFQSFLNSRWVRWEWYYEQYREGLIEQQNLPLRAWQRYMAQDPVYEEIWSENSEIFSPDFVAFMNENVFNL